MNNFLKVIIDVIRDKFDVSTELTGDTNLSDTGLDSLDIINLLFSIEERTGVQIPDAVIVEENIKTLGQLSEFVERQKGTAG